MTARLYIREAPIPGQEKSTGFEQSNGDFASETDARQEGERMCREGNVEEFQVWTLASHFRRVAGLEKVEAG